MSRTRPRVLTATLVVLLVAACGYNPTAPFEGFDGKGSRVTGSFGGGVSSQSLAAPSPAQGIRVYVREQPDLSTTVGSGGSFTIAGVPAGTITLVFERDGRVLSEIPLHDVRPNQEITIVVALVSDREIALVEQRRDRGSSTEDCPRGPGFWCENQRGQNPNLSAARFDELARKAASRLSSVSALDTRDEIARAVCGGDQLLRHLATLALNLEAETLGRGTALEGEPYPNVGAAFDAAVAAANGSGDAERIKDVLDRINNNQNHDACDNEDRNDDPRPTDPPSPPPGSGTGGLMCHGSEIPRGQLPPPGECKIWCPSKPAGQQGPPGRCGTLSGQVPGGCCLINHDGVV